ncbi:sigma-54-dependent Fis family transcriptional regulator [Candidatus Termititenax aidoneus]|uniref:DNA-binding transcriptional regulator NtrC n=1 Tax=Termititenax aidoneus TaxID=2218524 RepID=A0A388T7K1_TERA1|nr:sigma-54-dependent Fis family transcriptional regulator [Candidatus Termititenax aidoneus]
MTKILLVDDDKNMLLQLERILKSNLENLETLKAGDGKEALKLVKKENPQLVLMDMQMPGLNGLETFAEIKKAAPKQLVIMITGYGTTDTAIEAMKLGAYDYITKSPDLPEILLPMVNAALRASEIMNEVVVLENVTDTQNVNLNVRSIIGLSPKMQEVYKSVGKIAGTSIPVLLIGESGTGKELVARAVYHNSNRKDKTFLAINCAAIPETLLEAELFGYEKGAFTGANERKIGKFELCNGGTIFLDEIGDMPMSIQAKILRVLQEHELERVGGTETIKVDVRIISATNKNLQELIAAAKFREDLYYRLNGIQISLPALRERREDIPDIVSYFLKRFNYEFGKNISEIPTRTLEQLKKHEWPGNVRELENIVKRAVVTTTGPILQLNLRSAGAAAAETARETTLRNQAFDPATPLDALIDAAADSLLERMLIMPEDDPERRDLTGKLEKALIVKALHKLEENQVRTAKLLGITRNTLRSRIAKYGVQ